MDRPRRVIVGGGGQRRHRECNQRGGERPAIHVMVSLYFVQQCRSATPWEDAAYARGRHLRMAPTPTAGAIACGSLTFNPVVVCRSRIMKRSADRIITTHAGSLSRPANLIAMSKEVATGQKRSDDPAFTSVLAAS